jgi:hypothetical protein
MLDVHGRVRVKLHAGTNHYPISENRTYQLCLLPPIIKLHLLLSILLYHMTNYSYSVQSSPLNCDTERCDIRIQCGPHEWHALRQTLGIKLSSLESRTKRVHGPLECCSCSPGVCIHTLEHSIIGEHVAH